MLKKPSKKLFGNLKQGKLESSMNNDFVAYKFEDMEDNKK